MPEFFQTMMGRQFYEGTVPRIAKALEDIAFELKRQNKLKEEQNGKEDDSIRTGS